MTEEINYLEDLSNDLLRLSGLCNVLSCAEPEHSRPRYCDVLNSFGALRDILEAKVREINEVVGRCRKARAKELDTKP